MQRQWRIDLINAARAQLELQNRHTRPSARAQGKQSFGFSVLIALMGNTLLAAAGVQLSDRTIWSGQAPGVSH